MDITMEDLLTHPFTIGLGVGAILAVLAWFSGVWNQRKLRKEIKDLRNHLHLQMTVTAKGTEELQKELDSLRKQNENLRVSVSGLQQKPGRAELRTLQVYDRALNLMQKRAPGFAPVWQEVLQEAEEEIQKAEGGFGKLLKKVFRPAQITEASAAAKTSPAGSKGEIENAPEAEVDATKDRD
jgi:HAMP domain-containing protein